MWLLWLRSSFQRTNTHFFQSIYSIECRVLLNTFQVFLLFSHLVYLPAAKFYAYYTMSMTECSSNWKAESLKCWLFNPLINLKPFYPAVYTIDTPKWNRYRSTFTLFYLIVCIFTEWDECSLHWIILLQSIFICFLEKVISAFGVLWEIFILLPNSKQFLL